VGRILGACCLVLLLVDGRGAAAADGEPVVDGMKGSIVFLTSNSRADYLDSKLISAAIADLRAGSPTFRDLLAVLAASPRLLTLISTSTDVKYVHGMIGRTRFQVGPDRVVAFVDVFVERATARSRQEAIAHELAHIAEVACLGAFDDQDGLRRLLRSRAEWGGTLDNSVAIETGFAVRMGRLTVQEARTRARLTSQFARLATRSGLRACPLLPPGDGYTIVQKETTAAEVLFQER
jgi:hypothetical protein